MIYGLYLAYSAEEIGIEEGISTPYPTEFARVRIYSDKTSQLDAYANTMCAASQIIDAKDMDDFSKQVEQMKKNFQNEAWLEKNIYPYV